MKLTKMIYVASPYTLLCDDLVVKYLTQQDRYDKVTKVIGQLQDKYDYAFIGPITQSHHTVEHMQNKNTLFSDWKKRDLTYLSRCDELWVIKLVGWEDSKGVQEEILFATSHGIRVRFLNPKTLKFVKNKVKYKTPLSCQEQAWDKINQQLWEPSLDYLNKNEHYKGFLE